MDDEAIDTSVWLRRGDLPITHEMLSKGGIIYNNGVYQREFNHIIDWMLDARIIEQHHHTAGFKLIQAKTALNNISGTEKNFKSGALSGNGTPIDIATVFIRVSRELTRHKRANGIINVILFSNCNQLYIKENIDYVMPAFDIMAKILDNTISDMVKMETARKDSCAQN